MKLVTIGAYGFTPQTFVRALREHDVDTFVDLRTGATCPATSIGESSQRGSAMRRWSRQIGRPVTARSWRVMATGHVVDARP